MTQLSGTIQKGAGQAGELGAPTINLVIDLPEEIASGVYAATAELEDTAHNGVCFIGRAHLLEGAPLRVEMHLFNFSGGDLTGKPVTIKLQKHLRDEIPFTSNEQAQQIITKDLETARNYFN